MFPLGDQNMHLAKIPRTVTITDIPLIHGNADRRTQTKDADRQNQTKNCTKGTSDLEESKVLSSPGCSWGRLARSKTARQQNEDRNRVNSHLSVGDTDNGDASTKFCTGNTARAISISQAEATLEAECIHLRRLD